jgi:hypothetical protein
MVLPVSPQTLVLNFSTFLMPVEAFPTRIRSTAHGISAAIGKLGATAGSYGLLSMWYSYCGSAPTANDCSTVSSTSSQDGYHRSRKWCDGGYGRLCGCQLLGNVMTTLFVKETGYKTLEEVDASSKVLTEHDLTTCCRLLHGHGHGPCSPRALCHHLPLKLPPPPLAARCDEKAEALALFLRSILIQFNRIFHRKFLRSGTLGRPGRTCGP